MTEPEEVTKSERRWAMLAHVLSLVGWIIPLADLLMPATVRWLGGDSDYVRFHARSSLRFQVSNLIYKVSFLVLLGGCYLLLRHLDTSYHPSLTVWLLALAMVSLGMLGVLWLLAAAWMVLHAGVQAQGGVRYLYPLTLRFLR